ncbi:MAG: hypothetical protein JWO50_592 [Candidatus Kaiserbacteria bacterium]|nr:hypothetical protein [Candidatus Kaiserbacteria bacterium]
MKLLLTSAGITNQSIADSLIDLVGKKVEDIKIGFIPTAANIEKGNKDWFIRQFIDLYAYGFTWIDIVDISIPEIDWKNRFAETDVIMVSGGNTFYLLEQIRKAGFAEWLKTIQDTKVYVGISAGSIVATPSIAIAAVDNGDINYSNLTDLNGFGLVDFEVSPHTPEQVSNEGNLNYIKSSGAKLYGIDNQSAIRVVDGEVGAVSEGVWIEY